MVASLAAGIRRARTTERQPPQRVPRLLGSVSDEPRLAAHVPYRQEGWQRMLGSLVVILRNVGRNREVGNDLLVDSLVRRVVGEGVSKGGGESAERIVGLRLEVDDRRPAPDRVQ